MPRLRGAIPGCVGKGKAAESDVLDRLFRCALDRHEALQVGDIDRGFVRVDCRVFGVEVDFTRSPLLPPLVVLVEQLARVHEHIGGVAPLLANDGLRPGMLKFEVALGFEERQDGLLPLVAHLLDAQDSRGPTLMYHHLQPLGFFQPLDRGLGNGDGAVLRIEGDDALHLPLAKLIGAEELAAKAPELARQDRTAVPFRGIGHPAVALLRPIFQGGAADDKDLAFSPLLGHECRGRKLRAAILGAEVDRAIERVTPRREANLDAACGALIGRASPLARHLQGSMGRA